MWLRPIAALTLGLCPAVLALAMSCDRGATGEDACREIEGKRCEHLIGCAEAPEIVDEGDIVACRVFYRDQCLFGIANDSFNADPDEGLVEGCLIALDETAACKAAPGGEIIQCAKPVTFDPEVLRLAMNVIPENFDVTGVNACQLLKWPQALDSCSFLRATVAPPPTTTTAAAGGTGGTPSAGGTGGTGGT